MFFVLIGGFLKFSNIQINVYHIALYTNISLVIILNTQYKIHVKINKNITHQKQQPNTKQTNKTPKTHI
jgi:hypothetical protein